MIMNTHISNRLQSLVLDIGQSFANPLNSEDEKQSQLLDDDDYTKQYDSVQQLILSEDSLIAICRHPLFKQSSNKELHTQIYKLIIAKADDDSISPQILHIMQELHSNKNYMTSLANQISQTLKWTRKLKILTANINPRTHNDQQHDATCSSTDTDTNTDTHTDTDTDTDTDHFNPPHNESSSEDSTSSSCYYSHEEQPKASHHPHHPHAPTKPPIKEAAYSAINTVNKKRKRRKRKKRRKKQKKKNNENNDENNGDLQLMESRDYSHNFDQFSSGNDSLSDIIATDLKCNTISKPDIAEPQVPHNKKACMHCTFHNELTAKHCAMCCTKFDKEKKNTKSASVNENKDENKNNNQIQNQNQNNKKRARKRNRKGKFWKCKRCGEKNKTVAGQCTCGTPKGVEEHEWQCQVCTTINHINLSKCKSCSEKRIMPNGDWQCHNCYAYNQASDNKCRQCHRWNPSVATATAPNNKNKKKKNEYRAQRAPYNEYRYNEHRHHDYRGGSSYYGNRGRRIEGNYQNQYPRHDNQRRYQRKVQVPLNNQQQFKTEDNLSGRHVQQQYRRNPGYYNESYSGSRPYSSYQQNERGSNHSNAYNANNGPRIPPLSHNRNNQSTPPPSSHRNPRTNMDNKRYGSQQHTYNVNRRYPADDRNGYEFYGPKPRGHAKNHDDDDDDDDEPSTPPPGSNNNNNNQVGLSLNSIFNYN